MLTDAFWHFLSLSAFIVGLGSAAPGPLPDQITHLVTFGDSYTDPNAHGPGKGADGGAAWPTYAAAYGPFALAQFALSGSTCSHRLTNLSAYPSLFEDQLPTYVSAVDSGALRLDADRTVYTLWIGTNDVGALMILTGQQERGVTVVDTAACAVRWVDALYAAGARNFLFMNMIPLQHAPLYAPDSYPNPYWSAPRNTTAWSLAMTGLTASGNAVSALMLRALAPTLAGAHVGLFDAHGLFADMYARPSQYLNGTAPLNVTGAALACVVGEGAGAPECTTAEGSARDSFLWYDELHPSEQANRIVAKEVTDAVQRRSDRWTEWLS